MRKKFILVIHSMRKKVVVLYPRTSALESIYLDKSMFVTTFNLESEKANFVVSSSHFYFG